MLWQNSFHIHHRKSTCLFRLHGTLDDIVGAKYGWMFWRNNCIEMATVNVLMFLEISWRCKCFVASGARKWPCCQMPLLVYFKTILRRKLLLTLIAVEWPFLCVNDSVLLQIPGINKFFFAKTALKSLHSIVGFHMSPKRGVWKQLVAYITFLFHGFVW